ncbi:phage distal tail protein [Puerhibacterium puerhi]|uniref:phage distal tail protein n=1 Tax=Puerhibacterium puerhi TaxID=2692623 RepID=UPI00135C53AE|nr:hypothetical protein [Puerhibacterium puerhi]
MPVEPNDTEVFSLSGYEFGHVNGPWRTLDWEVIDLGVETTDAVINGRTLFGRDTAIPPVWRLRFRSLVPGGEAGAQDAVARLVQAWRTANTASPGTDVPLRYYIAGRWRRVWGRPRRLTVPTADPLVTRGRAEVTAEFQLTEAIHFDDTSQSAQVFGIPPSTGGIVAPLVSPLTTTKTSDIAYRFITVGGDIPAPIKVTFTGHATNPWARIGGKMVRLNGSIAAGQSVTVDSRAMTVLRNDGASVAGMLNRTTRLADLRLAPGTHEIQFGGGSGEASVTVAWSDAWRTL